MNNSLGDVIAQLLWPGSEAGEMPGDLSSDLGSVICFVLINIPLHFPGCLQSPPTVSEENKKQLLDHRSRKSKGVGFRYSWIQRLRRSPEKKPTQ